MIDLLQYNFAVGKAKSNQIIFTFYNSLKNPKGEKEEEKEEEREEELEEEEGEEKEAASGKAYDKLAMT